MTRRLGSSTCFRIEANVLSPIAHSIPPVERCQVHAEWELRLRAEAGLHAKGVVLPLRPVLAEVARRRTHPARHQDPRRAPSL